MDSKQDHLNLDIAIVGMSCRVPGARNWRMFWDNLQNGRESIRFLSRDELIESGVDAATLNDPSFVNASSHLDDKEFFDHTFFNYRPVEAGLMNPAHRIFHECVWEALEDAACDPERIKGPVSLYAGASVDLDWRIYSKLAARQEDIDEFFLSQIANKDYLASLISYKLDLRGAAFSINTACSTSLAAVHLASRALLLGEAAIAIAGGVSVSSRKQKGYLYKNGMIHSADGHCRAFSKHATGTVPGEGAGVVVLKRLRDALANHDHIYAVIKGSAVNNDGNNKVGFTAPSVSGQAECIKAALRFAHITSASVGYVEAHGTGTTLGDPIEIEALNLAFGKAARKSCAIGSVKSNIGHLDTAAGVVGLIKAALSIKHAIIPASLNYDEPNPQIDFDGGPFYVNDRLQEWGRKDGKPRIAGVSSFGIGGTNVHMVLAEAPARVSSPGGRSQKMLMLSSKSHETLKNYYRIIEDHLVSNPGTDLADMCYTFQVGRKRFAYRDAIAFETYDELLSILSTKHQCQSSVKTSGDPPVVFMFPGVGTQWVGMGKELYENEPAFRDELDAAFDKLLSVTGRNFWTIIYQGPLDSMIDVQPALFCFEYALAKMLLAWGIRPTCMIGLSIGEYVAACISGIFSFDDALKLVLKRGELMDRLPAGKMLSALLTEDECKRYLNENISVSAINSGRQLVFSGEDESINRLKVLLDADGVPSVFVNSTKPLHSHLMDGMLGEFRRAVDEIDFNMATIPFISNVSGRIIQSGESVDPGYWVTHMRQTVRFSEGLDTLFNKYTHMIFVEAGPGNTLHGLIKSSGRPSGSTILNLIGIRNQSASQARHLTLKLCQAWMNGVNIDWSAYYKNEDRKTLPLPTYPFARYRYSAEVDLEKERILKGIHMSTEPVPPQFDDTTASIEDPEWTGTEVYLVNLMREFFGIEDVSPTDNFFELGGDSLKAIILLRRINAAYGVSLELKDFFENSDIKSIAIELDIRLMAKGNTNSEKPFTTVV